MTRRMSGVKREILANVILSGEGWSAEGGPALAVEESLISSEGQVHIGILRLHFRPLIADENFAQDDSTEKDGPARSQRFDHQQQC
jgi:hypothetical protein